MNAFVCNGNVPQNVIKNFIDIFVSKVYIYDEDDDGPPRLKIIFDELETADLSGFNEADIPLGSTINIAGSPNTHWANTLCFKGGFAVLVFL